MKLTAVFVGISPVVIWAGASIAALPSADRLWVKVRTRVSIEELAIALSQDESRLARLNDVDEDHQFQSGDWLVLPSQSSRQVKQLASVDTSELRRTPPLESLPEPQATARVRFGDNLVKIAQRYNLTLADLLRLNPGLEAARLVVGTQIRTVQSTPNHSRMILGLKPTVSGGLSWPEQPGFSSGQANIPSPLLFSSKQLSKREQALLNLIRHGPPTDWRRYGQCQYDWAAWKLHPNGTRTTAALCGGSAMRSTIGVSCQRLLVATSIRNGVWSSWVKPAGPESATRAGEDEMVAALCANI